MHFTAFNRCPASLLHAGWLHQSWFCWNQPRETQRKETDEYGAEGERLQCLVDTSLVLARSGKKRSLKIPERWFL